MKTLENMFLRGPRKGHHDIWVGSCGFIHMPGSSQFTPAQIVEHCDLEIQATLSDNPRWGWDFVGLAASPSPVTVVRDTQKKSRHPKGQKY